MCIRDRPDGTVKLPTGSVIPAEGVVLPDGVKLTDVTKPTGQAPKPVASMPDGSKPCQPGGWEWSKWTSTVPSTNVLDAPLVSEHAVPKSKSPSQGTSPPKPSAPSQPTVIKADVKKQSKPSAPTAVQHFKTPDVPSALKPEVPTAEPEDATSAPEKVPDLEGKKKQSRFGLPSFKTSSGRKSKKEKPVGMQYDLLSLRCNV